MDAETSEYHRNLETHVAPHVKRHIMDGQRDEVVVNNKFSPGHGGGGDGGGLPIAAVIAAMGNRNSGDGMGHHFGGAIGAGLASFGGAAVGSLFTSLLNRDRFGAEGCAGGAATPVLDAAILNGVQQLQVGQGDIKLAVAEQTTSLNGTIGQLALGTQIGMANLGDKVTNTGSVLAAVLGNINTSMLQGFASVNATTISESSSVKTLLLQQEANRLQQALTVAQLSEVEGRNVARHNELSLKIENNNTNMNTAMAQATAIAVARTDEARWARLEGIIAINHQDATQKIFNLGTMTGSGTLAASNNQMT